MAPEMLLEIEYEKEDRNRYTSKVDIWSMGVVLYVMLSNEYPFYGEEEIKDKALGFRALEWMFVSQATKKFIRKVLMKTPLFRPTAAELLNDDWFVKYKKTIQKAEEAMKRENESV